jgi:uncharacterized protein (DUF362 family)
MFSPRHRYPEYPFGGHDLGENDPYDLVRSCLAAAGAGAADYGSDRWNPLREWISEGERVFVLPNLVTHGRDDAHFARLTHGSVLRAVMDYAIMACGDPRLASFGNAPLQSCDYDRVTVLSGCQEVADFYRCRTGAMIGAHDLREVVSQWTRYGAMMSKGARDAGGGVEIDLGRDSLIDELFQGPGKQPKVRVGDYPVSETMGYHSRGRHVYVINRRVLEAGVLISVPKLKTHQKVGLTVALKGTVGTVTRKECLAHHRAGGPAQGGDEYAGNSRWRRIVSSYEGRVSSGGTGIGANLARVSSKIISKATRGLADGTGGGAWYGNDTAWRMALDLARILRYARPDGTMSDVPVRRHIVFVDGIVAGQGNGPLRPSPVAAHAVLFAPDPCAADYASALAMGFDPQRIPLVSRAFGLSRYPLTELEPGEIRALLNGREGHVTPLAKFEPSRGWKRHIEIAE